MRPLPPAVLRLWRTLAIVAGALVAVGGIAIEIAARRGTDWDGPPAVLGLGAGLVVGLGAWGLANLRYRAWRFELTDEWIQARWGVIYHRSGTVPRNRVQTVTSENGPVDRLLGLTSVTIHTAGAGAPNLAIPHLAEDTVAWLRDELARGAVTPP